MLRIGILGCAEIAYRRFMPAVLQCANISVKIVAEEYDKARLQPFCAKYDLECASNFADVITRNDIDAVYIPQPPALHFRWAKAALEQNKHVLLEKPATTGYKDTLELVHLAHQRQLALHENYMFQYHSQIESIRKILSKGDIGDVRLIRANFGFPMRCKADFRYNAALGGGALWDAGGYIVKLATLLLGKTAKVDTAKLISISGSNVDMMGSVTLSNTKGIVFQGGFGLDCHYQCCLEIWGSKGRLYTDRIFTAPPEYTPIVIVEQAEQTDSIKLNPDSHFLHSIEKFYSETINAKCREEMYEDVILQAQLIEKIYNIGGK